MTFLLGELQPEQISAPIHKMLHAGGKAWDCCAYQFGSDCVLCPHMQWGYTGRDLQSLQIQVAILFH